MFTHYMTRVKAALLLCYYSGGSTYKSFRHVPPQTGQNSFIFVYQMGRLCGGAHEISGIKALIFLRGWVGVGVVGDGGE